MQQNSFINHDGGVAMFTPSTIATVTPSYSRLNLSAVRGLSVSQIVLGAITFVFGVISAFTLGLWFVIVFGGIWSGLIFLASGILGIAAVRAPHSGCLVGATLTLNSIAIMATVAHGIMSTILAFYTASSTGKALYGTSFAIMVIEFILAFSTSIFCCRSCCSSYQQGAIISMYPNQGLVINGINSRVQQPILCDPVPANYLHEPSGGVWPDVSAYPLPESEKAGIDSKIESTPSDPPPYYTP